MVQEELSAGVGYALKRAQAALRAAMDATLREHGLTTPQYACLEALGRRPGISNAELARTVFVTRQSTDVVLRVLRDAGLVERAGTAEHGRALPTRLTEEGHRRLAVARSEVNAIESRMVAPLDPDRIAGLAEELVAMARAVETGM